VNLTINILKTTFNAIQDLRDKDFFLILAETSLSTDEALLLSLDSVNLEYYIIILMKEGETKRTYITFLHESTAE